MIHETSTRPARALTLTAVITAAIVTLSLTPAPSLPPAPGSDKLHHIVAYAAAALPCALWHPRALIWVLPALVGVSGAIELIQPAVNRYGEWADMGANLGGLGIGAALGLALRRIRV